MNLICPMMSYHIYNDNQIQTVERVCAKERCAWWHADAESCSILNISWALQVKAEAILEAQEENMGG